MAIAITEIKRAFRYNGIQLPDVPGLALVEVRDLYSAQYPELISAEMRASVSRSLAMSSTAFWRVKSSLTIACRRAICIS